MSIPRNGSGTPEGPNDTYLAIEMSLDALQVSRPDVGLAPFPTGGVDTDAVQTALRILEVHVDGLKNIESPSEETLTGAKRVRMLRFKSLAKKRFRKGTQRTLKAVRGIFRDFYHFLSQGRAFELAIGLVIGAALTTVVTSLVTDIFSPILGLAIGSQLENVFVYLKRPDTHFCENNATACEAITTPAQAHALGGVTWNYGAFLQNLINFFFVAILIFAMIRTMLALQRTHQAIMHRVRYQGSMSNLKGTRARGAKRAPWSWFGKKSRVTQIQKPRGASESLENVYDTERREFGGGTQASLTNASSDFLPPGSPHIVHTKGKHYAQHGRGQYQLKGKKTKERECPYCCMVISAMAMRCPFCTSNLTDMPPSDADLKERKNVPSYEIEMPDIKLKF
ncbi:hypothetical protein HDU67_006825 [Dinochytrium kinnereticum]|nr:hypothetical protein HDU67_006825 [Dinochytrium kinnereticum]